MRDNFRQRVIKFIKTVPKGKVASYGQAAAACGKPLAARAVGGILRSSDVEKENIPWWRVVNNQGIISIKGSWVASKELQRSLLVKEGIKVDENFTLDISKYRY
jgi:methylated-DNA-protein-cysteine methyltransferase-like protein